MNGVMMPSVSAGSSQRDASVMCTPHVIVPSGAAAAEAAGPLERTTPEPASAADIFSISRRLSSPTEQVAILSPFQRRALKLARRPEPTLNATGRFSPWADL